MVGLVYVVDDDDGIRSGLRLLLESNGWETETYARAEAFLLEYSPRYPSCLLLDMDMPGMSGAELQEALAARGVSLPIIVMTANDERQLLRRVKAAGAVAVLSKPFRADALLPLVERAIMSDTEKINGGENVTTPHLMHQLRVDHANASKVLDVLKNQLRSATLEQTADYALMGDAMRYMTLYPDIAHHPTEDRVFEFVVLRAPHAKDMTAELKQEHAALAEKGMTFLDALCHVVDGVMVERDSIASSGHDYIQFLEYHMRKEEEQIFPLAENVLRDDDWRAVNDGLTDMRDPIFGPVVQEDYRQIYQLVTQSAS